MLFASGGGECVQLFVRRSEFAQAKSSILVSVEFFEDCQNVRALFLRVFARVREERNGVSVVEFVHAQFRVLFVVGRVNS